MPYFFRRRPSPRFPIFDAWGRMFSRTLLLLAGCAFAASAGDDMAPDARQATLPPPAPYAPGPSDQALDRWPFDRVDPASLAPAIDTAADYLLDNLLPSGRFAYIRFLPEYEREPDTFTPAAPHPAKYNLLRHAGALYAMTQARERALARNDDENRRRAERLTAACVVGAKFLHRFIKAVPVTPRNRALAPHPMLAVWSPPGERLDPDDADPAPPGPAGADEPDFDDEPDAPLGGAEAKLGGAGLALVALGRIERFAPGTTDLDVLRGLGRFIIFMQRPNGSFHSILDETGTFTPMESLYYPGEAILGMIHLAECDPKTPDWLACAAWGMGYLARSRAEQLLVPPDHWALIATEALLARYDRLPRAPVRNPDRPSRGNRMPVNRAMLRRHAAQIVENILAEQFLAPGRPTLHGAFRDDGTLTPVTTRLEGLLAALTALRPEEAPREGRDPDESEAAEETERYVRLAEQIREAMDPALSFVLRHQARAGGLRGGIPRAAALMPWPTPPRPPATHNAMADFNRQTRQIRRFNRRVWEVRIDYVQHALSALIGYEAATRPPPDASAPSR